MSVSIPVDMPYTTGILSSFDGTPLLERSWTTLHSPIGSLLVVHGIGEHAGRYGPMAEVCTSRGFDVRAFDLRGHGESGGTRGHVDRWASYLEDLAFFERHVQKDGRTNHRFLLGHSFGALIALDYVIARKPTLDALIISGVPLKPAGVATPVRVLLARFLSLVAPRIRMSLGLEASELSRDQDVVEAYKNDPSIFDRVSVRWAAETLAAVERIRDELSVIDLPILIVHGEKDTINLVDGARELYEQVSSFDKTLEIVPEGKHEPHRDTNGDAVAAFFCDWAAERAHAAG